jgi:hypothetical protein
MWMLSVDDTDQGPLSTDDLLARIHAGALGPNAVVRPVSTDAWAPLASVPVFGSALAARWPASRPGLSWDSDEAIRAGAISAVFAIAGYCAGQYYPFMSDLITQNACQPFSPCRNSAAIGYAIGGLVFGLVVGIGNEMLRAQAKRQ